jgi:REP element-mobilizing transposase RayT
MPIFKDADDYRRYLRLAAEAGDCAGVRVLAYALMPNHAHFLIEAESEQLSSFFRRLGVRHVGYFNRRHKRVGHLFQDRFKSKPVEDEAYFGVAVTYIHLNPVSGGLAKEPADYRWSSRRAWTSPDGLTDTARLAQLADLGALRQQEEDALRAPPSLAEPFPRRKGGRPRKGGADGRK